MTTMNASYQMPPMGSTSLSLSNSNASLSANSMVSLPSALAPALVSGPSGAALPASSSGGGSSNASLDPIDRLKFFLATAPTSWKSGEAVKRYNLGNGEQISCVYWKNLFYVTGTDIVKILLFRFQAIHRAVVNTKKFEEGIFSDLRNLKPGVDATLEEPRSEFLEVLYRHGCIRTQKKQKVFFWFSVPHDRLFMDALERDLKRESNMIHVNSFLNKASMMTPNMGQMSLGGSPMVFHSNLPATGHHAGAGAAIYGSLQGSPAMGTSTLMNAYMPSVHQMQLIGHHGSPMMMPIQHASVGHVAATPLAQYNRSPQQGWQYMDQGVAYAQPGDALASSSLASGELLGQGSQEELATAAPHRDYSQDFTRAEMFEVDDAMIDTLINEDELAENDCSQEVSLMLIDNNSRSSAVDAFAMNSESLFGYDYTTGTIIEDPSLEPTISPAAAAAAAAVEGRTYECTFQGCGRPFKRVEHLKRHYRSHTGERPFICPVEGCGKSFSRSDNLAQHSKVHAGAPMFVATAAVVANAVLAKKEPEVSGTLKDYHFAVAASEHREAQAQEVESLIMSNMNQRRPIRPPTDNILNVIEDSYGFLQ